MESITLYNSSVRLMVRNNSTEDQYTKELQMRDQDVKTCTTRIERIVRKNYFPKTKDFKVNIVMFKMQCNCITYLQYRCIFLRP